MEISKTLNKISPLLSEFHLESEAKPLLNSLENTKKTYFQSNKENISTNLQKKPQITQKFIQSFVSSSQNRVIKPSNENITLKENNKQEDHNKYIKKLVGLDISQTFQAIDEPMENLPQIDDISIIKEENLNQITMIEHSEASQNNTFLQKEDPNESSLINYEESEM